RLADFLPCLLLPDPTPYVSFFFWCYRSLRNLHSFPTRRSSDLSRKPPWRSLHIGEHRGCRDNAGRRNRRSARPRGNRLADRPGRSEEHTSELQSRENLVCRLLLEKKKELTVKHVCKKHNFFNIV